VNQVAGKSLPRAILKSVLFVFACLLGVFILFLLVEGLGSTVFVIHDYVSYWTRVVDMEHSTQYDAELGWVNIPNFYSKDFYDPGVYVQTNSQGFRNREEFTLPVPPTRLRVVCTGASMTFGVGVDNDHVWCQQLSSLDHRLQAVNMGVPGYGLDQVYLLQRRESQLDYDVQILAICTDYFRRMTKGNLLGYDKPMLVLRGDELVTTHVPVPKSSIFTRWTYWIAKLKSVAMLQKVRGKLQPARHLDANLIPTINRNTERITAQILKDEQAGDRSRKRITVVLFLPALDELTGTGTSTAWRDFLRDESARQGIPFLDLLDDARKLPISELDKLFIPNGSQRYGDTGGHFSDYGNEYVSRQVYQVLAANPEVAGKLSGLR
jgi:hypothetical protein